MHTDPKARVLGSDPTYSNMHIKVHQANTEEMITKYNYVNQQLNISLDRKEVLRCISFMTACLVQYLGLTVCCQ